MKKFKHIFPLIMIALACILCVGCGHEASEKELMKLEKQATKYLKKTYPDQTFVVEAKNEVSSGNGLPTTIYQLITATDENGITFRVLHSRKRGWYDDYEGTKKQEAYHQMRQVQMAMEDKYSFEIHSSHEYWTALDTLHNDSQASDNLSNVSHNNFIAYYAYYGTDSQHVETLCYQTDEIPSEARTTLIFYNGDEQDEFHQPIYAGEHNDLMAAILEAQRVKINNAGDEDGILENYGIVFWSEDTRLCSCIIGNVLENRQKELLYN